MFTGLVQSLAVVKALEHVGPGVRLTITEKEIAANSGIGDSVAINGCCLTVVHILRDGLFFEAGEETLGRTNLGELEPESSVNLETSLKLGDNLGGHLVTGHIDAVGILDNRQDDAEWSKLWFRVPAKLTSQMASKGSVAVDGVSLTLVDVELGRFSVALIPHTLKATTLGWRRAGDRVNIETDVLAKYVERQLAWRNEQLEISRDASHRG
jgi:riboflavin synthase